MSTGDSIKTVRDHFLHNIHAVGRAPVFPSLYQHHLKVLEPMGVLNAVFYGSYRCEHCMLPHSTWRPPSAAEVM